MITIPHNTCITGELKCEGNIEVMGRINGDSDIKGLLVIGKDCIWTGKAVADNIIVEGFVDGKIIARKRLEIKPSAKISGSIVTPELLIPKGANLNCELTMQRNKQAVSLQAHRKQKKLIIPSFKKSADNQNKGEALPENVSNA